jgi:transcriptional regulator with XRE-family HTH domain
MSKFFGDRVKELRVERHLTQSELAKIFNTGKASISHYESNTRLPDVNAIAQFAQYFDVTIEYMMGKTDNRKYDSITIYPPKHIKNTLPQNFYVDSETKKLFSERVKDRIVNEELTKNSLSKLTGIKKDIINKYISGELVPDVSSLKKLASVLNTTSDYLLGLNENPAKNEINILEDWVVIKEGTQINKIPTRVIRDFLNSTLKEKDK